MPNPRFKNAVWLLLFLSLSLTACGSTKIVEKPVVVEVQGPTEYIAVPADFLIQHEKTTLPETLTYGDALQLWAEDRALVDKLNGQIAAISELDYVE